MKSQENLNKRNRGRILRALWFSLGGIILILDGVMYAGARSLSNNNAIGHLVWFILLFEAFAIFLGITGVYYFIKFIIHLVKREKNK
jgi:hypothetical protein